MLKLRRMTCTLLSLLMLAQPLQSALAAEVEIPAPEIQETAPLLEPSLEPSPAPENTPPSPAPTEPPAMQLAQTRLTLGVRETAQLSVSFADGQEHGHIFKTEDGGVAKVSESGLITARDWGETTVWVKSEFGQKQAVELIVRRAPEKLKLNAPRTELLAGDEIALEAKLSKDSASKITYQSNDEAIATVSSEGVVRAVAPGAVTITARTFNGRTAKIKLAVLVQPEWISLDAGELTLGVGQEYTFQPGFPEGSLGECSFHCDAPKILEIDGATVRALQTGFATVTAETPNGKAASCAITVRPAPTGVRLAAESIRLGVGETAPLPEVDLGEGCAGSYSLKSSKEKVAAIGADGLIHAKGEGSAKITVTTHNGHSAKLLVTVQRAPKSISLNHKALTLGVGETEALKVTLSGKSGGSVTLTSSDPAVASIADGVITALAPGQATITAETFNGKTASCTVTVGRAPDSISIPAEELVLGAGEKRRIRASLPEGCAGSYSFAVADEAVARINENGALVGVAPGTTQITVRAYNGCEAHATLTVLPGPKGVKIQEKKITLFAGDSYQLQRPSTTGEGRGCGGFTYISGNERYFTVDANGLLTGLRKGSAKLYVRTYNGKQAEVKVHVKAAPKAIAFEEDSLRLLVGESHTPEIAAAYNYTLHSENPAVAQIVDGCILAVSGGSTQIIATSYNGKTAALPVTVPHLPDDIRFSPALLTLGIGESRQLQPVMPEGQDSALRFESLHPEIAAVDESGCVTPLSTGRTTIRVHTQNGLSAACDVQVKRAPGGVLLSPASVLRCIDEGGFQLQASLPAGDEAGEIRFSSSAPAVATVSADGWVSLVSPGTATLRAETYNGHTASCALVVGQRPAAMGFESEACCVALGDLSTILPHFEDGCESYSLSSSDPAVLQVRGTQVYGASLGRATLTATSRSGFKASCAVEVLPPPGGVWLDVPSAKLVLYCGPANLQLHGRTLPDGTGSVYYTSSDPAIATVDRSSGMVTAIAPGECTIWAYSYDGRHSAACEIRVALPLEGVKIGIDPGHQAEPNDAKESASPRGGARKPKVSAGATGVSTGIEEHVTNLRVALRLRKLLRELGAEVYMTRESADVDISNKRRALMMNELGVDLVLRLHCNGADNDDAHGVELYSRKSWAYKDKVSGKAVLKAEKQLNKALMQEICAATGAKRRRIIYNNDYTGNN